MTEHQHARVDAAVTDLTRYFPVLAEARNLAPAFYGRLLAAVGDALDAGGSDQAAVDAGRAVVRQYYREQLPGVPAALLLRVLQLTLAEAREAARSSPQLCVDLLLGRPVGDIAAVLDPATRRDEIDMFEAVLRAPRTSEALVASDDAVAQAVASASQAGAAMLGMPRDDFSAAVRGDAPAADSCAAMTAFVQALTQLAPAQQASVFRRLIGGGQAAAAGH